MIKLLRPCAYVPSIFAIDADSLWGAGIRGLILDLDNTLAPWKAKDFSPQVREWVNAMKIKGFRICLVSNGRTKRVTGLVRELNIPVVCLAQKPRKKGFVQAMRILQLEPSQTAVIGDQLFTDILGGNRLTVYTILVEPIDRRRELHSTKLLRIAEKVLLRRYKGGKV